MPFQWITLAIATSLALAGLTGWRVQRHKLDLWYLCAIVPFMILAALELAAGYGVLGQGLYVPGTRLAYQAIILGVSIFLLVLLRGGNCGTAWSWPCRRSWVQASLWCRRISCRGL